MPQNTEGSQGVAGKKATFSLKLCPSYSNEDLQPQVAMPGAECTLLGWTQLPHGQGSGQPEQPRMLALR